MSVIIDGAIVRYVPQVPNEKITRTVASVLTHKINDYTGIERALDTVLSSFDQSVEISPSPYDLRLDGEREWNGLATISTRIDVRSIEFAVRGVFERAGFRQRTEATPPTRADYELTFLEPKKKPGYTKQTFLLFPYVSPDSAQSTLHEQVTLPLDRDPMSPREPLSPIDFPPEPPLPDMSILAQDCFQKQAQFRMLHEATARYLDSIGQLTEDAAAYLNQANWNEILHSLGPVATITGFAAWGAGGFVGKILEAVSALTGTARAAITASDYASSEQARNLLQDLETLAQTYQYSAIRCEEHPPPHNTREAAADPSSSESEDEGWQRV